MQSFVQFANALFIIPTRKSTMKIAYFKIWATVGALAFSAASVQAAQAPATSQQSNNSQMTFKNDEEKLSYILGHHFASSLLSSKFKLNNEVLAKAFADGINGKKSVFSEQESQESLQKLISEQRKIIGDENLKSGEAFLNKNKKEKGVVTLKSGLQYKILKAGKGKIPKSGDTVTVKYTGTLVDGTVFDKSKEPITFPVEGVIKGWTEALKLMPEGSHWMLYIPASLGYGAQQPSEKILPNSALVFDVELVSIAKPTPPTTPQAAAPNAAKEQKK